MATANVTYTFAPLTDILSSEANTNFDDLVTFLNTEVVQKDASVAFTAVPSGPATDPVSDNQYARKAYVDGVFGLIEMAAVSLINAPSLTDVGGNWTSVANRGITTSNTGFTVVTTGAYEIGFSTSFALSTGIGRTFTVRVNGVQVDSDFVVPDIASSGVRQKMAVTRFLTLTAGDVLTYQYRQDSGASLACVAQAWVRTRR